MDFYFILSLLHVLVVAPLFFLIAFFRSEIPDWGYQALLVLGIFLVIYHGYKAVGRFWANSQYTWVNLIHVLFVGPLLMYIGYNKKNTGKWAYESCILVGSAALGYHTYVLAKTVNAVEPK